MWFVFSFFDFDFQLAVLFACNSKLCFASILFTELCDEILVCWTADGGVFGLC